MLRWDPLFLLGRDHQGRLPSVVDRIPKPSAAVGVVEKGTGGRGAIGPTQVNQAVVEQEAGSLGQGWIDKGHLLGQLGIVGIEDRMAAGPETGHAVLFVDLHQRNKQIQGIARNDRIQGLVAKQMRQIPVNLLIGGSRQRDHRPQPAQDQLRPQNPLQDGQDQRMGIDEGIVEGALQRTVTITRLLPTNRASAWFSWVQ
jgi:hypothetical protein